MLKLLQQPKDAMTPAERRLAIARQETYDRLPALPFMGEFKCLLTGTSVWDFWHDPVKMAETEIKTFNRYGYDRIVIGPNTRGMMEALGGQSVYPEYGAPYADGVRITDYKELDHMTAADAERCERFQVFAEEAELLCEAGGAIVPMESSIGGPFTIAAQLRGVENLLRDCRKCPESVHRLLRLITDTQKSWIDRISAFDFGIAMADPVANPALIGAKMYEQFVFPYTKELTVYALEKTGKKVSLHMCGKTYKIWPYLIQYPLNEISLDNVIDLARAAEELGAYIPIAGNVDPVETMLNGSREDIFREVKQCIAVGVRAKNGYVLTTGCDIPERTRPENVDWFMDAARSFGGPL